MKIAVVGATGMVGNVMLEVLEERNFPVTELLVVASERSVGKTILYNVAGIRSLSFLNRMAGMARVVILSANM